MSEREVNYATVRAREIAELGQDPTDLPIFWGKSTSRPATCEELPKNQYLKAACDSHLPLLCSPSGFTADLFGLLPMLGLKDESTKYGLRLASLATLLAGKNHSAIEILTAARSWGLPCSYLPDYYLHLFQKGEPFIKDYFVAQLKSEQERRGFELLPYEYLV